jgi:hypothetical protein
MMEKVLSLVLGLLGLFVLWASETPLDPIHRIS